MKPFAALAVLSFVCSCGSETSTSDVESADAAADTNPEAGTTTRTDASADAGSACTIALTGALTATVACDLSVAPFASSETNVALTTRLGPLGASVEAGGSLRIQGTPSVKTYALGDLNENSQLSAVAKGDGGDSLTWLANKATMRGTYSLTLTSADPVHGSVHGELTPLRAPATGTVVFDATF